MPANEGNALALHFLVGHLRGLAYPRERWAGADDCGEVRKGNAGIFAKRHQGTQHIAHLPHVPWPVKCEQRLPRPGLDVYPLPLRLLTQQKVQQLRLVTAFAYRRQRDLQAIEAVIQVLAETALFNPFQQVTVRSADDAHVHRLRLSPDRHHLALLQHPQQSGLQGKRHIADLVQQQGAAVGLQQLAAHALLARAGKTAAAVPEKLTLDQAFRDRRAVDGDERLAAPLTGLMHSLGEGFLATAGLAAQQQWHIALEHPHAAAEIILQRRVKQTDQRLHFTCGPRLGGRHRPHRRPGLPPQAGEHLATVQGAQRPDSTAAGRGTAEHFVMAAREKALQRFAQHATPYRTQQVQCALVGSANAPIAVERQQAFAEQADRLGLQVKTQ